MKNGRGSNAPGSVPLKVFISRDLLNANSGHCFGRWMPDKNLAFILAIEESSAETDQDLIPFIYWENLYMQTEAKKASSDWKCSEIELIFVQHTFNGLPSCRYQNTIHNGLGEDIILIVFDEENVKGHKLTSQTMYNEGHTSEVNILSDLLRQSERREQRGVKWRGVHLTLAWLMFLVKWPLCTTLKIFLSGYSAVEQMLSTDWIQHLVSLPMLTSHLATKINILKGLTMQREDEDKNNEVDKLRVGNKLLILLVDLVLGCLVCYFIHKYHLQQILSHNLIKFLQSTSLQLQELLRWLMGAPAGLKLNSGYAHFLGHFFLYQSYLWIGYLYILYPIMDNIIWGMTISGCLGLTVLLAVASDILSLLTFHIYCFYVYAAKIFTLQLSALTSLSRLFRGRKWNVLRSRVDSCIYDIDQLAVGTLIFTVLLFLLPTSLLFYSVFTALQMVVLVIRGTIALVIHHLSTFPWYTAVKWLLRRPVLRDQLSFIKLRGNQDSVVCLVLQLQLMSLTRAVSLTREVYQKKPRAAILAGTH
ncbi:putative phosphatidylinositol N-acetylglucosaminyltransferase subunit Q [Apostichopus japonicus]|uniref:Putative phosphatidylinositol N-acetylglucosaminyltransferase subunit Q n=1 Tax=Stichopus japonicus TaxID=307972 RepID=A0A2G8KU22_STIJA|nr:putative phosphatidylinositol N-acetylglucosaminyltransferase subunit Q [Apostichopus japonicus]